MGYHGKLAKEKVVDMENQKKMSDERSGHITQTQNITLKNSFYPLQNSDSHVTEKAFNSLKMGLGWREKRSQLIINTGLDKAQKATALNQDITVIGQVLNADGPIIIADGSTGTGLMERRGPNEYNGDGPKGTITGFNPAQMKLKNSFLFASQGANGPSNAAHISGPRQLINNGFQTANLLMGLKRKSHSAHATFRKNCHGPRGSGEKSEKKGVN